jgi:beta-mannosidase
MIVHQKAVDGNAKLATGLQRHYRVPDDMETWHWAMQLNQANAVSCALEWFRALAPHTSGAVVWQLNDCWPVTSWAAVDGDGRKKPLYFALQNAFAPRLVTLQPRRDALTAVLVNDTDLPWEGDAVLSRRAFSGRSLASTTLPVHVPARGSLTVDVPDDVAAAGDPASELVVAEALDTRGTWFLTEPRDSRLPAPQARVEVSPGDGGVEVTVTAGVVLRDLTLLVDKVDPAATVDRGLVTLLPGESTTFRVRGVDGLDVEAVGAPGVLRSGNELITG